MIEKINHWALDALGTENLKRAREISDKVFLSRTAGSVFNYQFSLNPKQIELLEKSVNALELVAIDNWNDMLDPPNDRSIRERYETPCAQAFHLAKALPVPKGNARLFHVLHLISLAYAAGKWTDARRWVKEHPKAVEIPSTAQVDWQLRILYRLFEAWVCIIRKNGWHDLERVAEIVTALRKDQQEYEKTYLTSVEGHSKSNVAWSLVALYHLAAATEILATFQMQGKPADSGSTIDMHFEKAINAAQASMDAEFEILLRWLQVSSKHMLRNSIWRVAHSVSSSTTKYIDSITKNLNIFEMLPPQRAALLEEGLLDPAKKSILINLPTSAGKTTLASFRLLQALNQFSADKGWVAYTAPTRALVAQLTRRLREEMEPIGIHVEQLSGAIEIDSFEESMLTNENGFDVLVTTPEKLDLVIRNKVIARPLSLVIVDEAHNIQDDTRGLKLELLLATIKRDCASASFLLMTPFIPNGEEIAEWLAPTKDSSKSISLALSPWIPNDRIIGYFNATPGEHARKWKVRFNTLQTTPGTAHLKKSLEVGQPGIVDETFSKVSRTDYLQTAAVAKSFSDRRNSTVLAIATKIDTVWSMAKALSDDMPVLTNPPEELVLSQKFLQAEFGPNFQLARLLEKGVGVHHAGLSDEARLLVEKLAEKGQLKVICATTTIAQGINFPISSVFLASTKYPYGKEMPPRDFWNLAGRTGRMFQESLGVIGISSRYHDSSRQRQIREFVKKQTEALVSTLVGLVDDVFKAGKKLELEAVLHLPQWRSFWGYLAHIYNDIKSPELMATQAEQILRNTLGYKSLESKSKTKAVALLELTREYSRRLNQDSHLATLADATGFSPESIRIAIGSLNGQVSGADWDVEGLFGGNKKPFRNIMGVLLNLPETRDQLREITNVGLNNSQLANLTTDWVNGKSIEDIAKKYFKPDGAEELTSALSNTCKAIYGKLTNSATWGLATLSKLPTSGIDFDSLTESEKRTINLLPAMIYYGVSTEEAVLMRMNGVPRRIAQPLAQNFKEASTSNATSVVAAKSYLRGLGEAEWQKLIPSDSYLQGKDYRQIWSMLTGYH